SQRGGEWKRDSASGSDCQTKKASAGQTPFNIGNGGSSGGLFLLTRDADRGPGNRIQPRQANFLVANSADSITSILDSADCRFDSAQQLCVGLAQADVNVDLVIVARLVHEIAVPGIFHVLPVSLLSCRADDRVAFLLQDRSEPSKV